MRSLRLFVALLLCCATSAFAAPASEETIRQILSVTNARALAESVLTQMDANISQGINQSLQGKQPNPAQQQAIERFKARMVTTLREVLAWDKLEAMNIRLYKEAFSEEELKGILAFYKTPAGQAVIHKMPTLMAQTMREMQQTMVSVTPALLKIQQEFGEEMKAAAETSSQ